MVVAIGAVGLMILAMAATSYVALMTGYGALYVGALIVAATVVFSRRDFK